MKINKKEIIFAMIAITLGILTRTIFDLGINIEMITGFAIVSGFFFKDKKLAYTVPLVSMILSDIIIKNSAIFIFTWSGFLVGPLIGSSLRLLSNKYNFRNFGSNLVGSQAAGIISTMVFFLWTNFGVWIMGGYQPTAEGLMQSYINAIPFLTNQLVSNLLFVPLVFAFGFIFFNFEKFTNPITNKSIE